MKEKEKLSLSKVREFFSQQFYKIDAEQKKIDEARLRHEDSIKMLTIPDNASTERFQGIELRRGTPSNCSLNLSVNHCSVSFKHAIGVNDFLGKRSV